MNNELIQAIGDTFISLRMLIISRLVKPLKDKERCTFPHGYVNVMYCIESQGAEPVSMTDLAAAASIAKPNLTSMVDRLLEEGLVERSPDLNDRRIVNIALTREGIDFLKRQKKDMKGFIADRIFNLEEDDLLKLKNALDDISDVIKKMDWNR